MLLMPVLCRFLQLAEITNFTVRIEKDCREVEANAAVHRSTKYETSGGNQDHYRPIE
jgi:hypothetical protein